MNFVRPPRALSVLFSGAVAALTLAFASPLFAQIELPAGNLTVTVEELAGGEVRFSVSGTATMQGFSSNLTHTNTQPGFPGNPPHSPFAGGFYPLPAGMFLTAADSANEVPSQAFAVTGVGFEGSWALTHEAIQSMDFGDTLTGSGSVTVGDVPFTHFVPGTYLVEPGSQTSELESGVAEGQETEGFAYSITYEVIPFTSSPGLLVSTPERFPRTAVDQSGGSRKVTIKNTGNLPISRLTTGITGGRRGEFTGAKLSTTELKPGDSTEVTVDFRPARRGVRRAQLTVSGVATFTRTEAVKPKSKQEIVPEEGESEQPQTITIETPVSQTVNLIGRGIDGPNVNSPRFPRGSFGN